MKTLPLILTSTVLASAVSVGVMTFMKPGEERRDGQGPEVAQTDAEAAAAARIADLELRVEQLTKNAVQPAAGPERTALPAVDAAMIDAAVARHFESMGANAPGAAETLAKAMDASSNSDFEAKTLFDELRANSDMKWDDIAARWNDLTPEQQDELLKQYEALANANPNDASAQNALGEAYVQRLMNSDMAGMMKYGQLAEAQFDEALELDDHHWGARFNKAMSLSNQPAFLGKQPEAIQHFTTLMGQQEASPLDPKHEATYLFLGNMHAQAGNAEKARTTWERGVGRFPGSTELRKRLGQ